MKNSTKISVLISLVLISLLALGAVSAADDTAVADDANLAAVDDVQTVDDAPTTDEIDYESNDIVVTDTGDSGDLDDADTDVISDTGLKNDSDNGEEAVVSDASSPKSVLKAEIEPEEPLGAPEDDPVGTFTQLFNLIRNTATGGTLTLTQNYAYNPNTDYRVNYGGEYRYFDNGLYIDKAITINGNGHFISGSNDARIFDLNAATLTLNNLTLKEGNAHNSRYQTGTWTVYTQYYGGAIYAHGRNVALNINNCTIVDNHADGNSQYWSGGAIYSTGTCNILNSVLVNNSAYNGGFFTSTGTMNIHGSVIFDNTASNATGGNNGFRSNGNANLEYNWWGSNKGAEFSIATATAGTYASVNDWFILTETLSSPTTVDVDFELYRGGTSQYKIPGRIVTITTDADTCNTTTAVCPDPFVIEFTTSNDAYINASVDHEQQHLKVFAGENKKNITVLYVEVEDVILPAQPIAYVHSDIDGIYNLTLGTEIFPVNVTNGVGTYQFTNLGVGRYTVIVSRVDDPVYKTTFNTTDFEVKRYATELVIDAETPNPTYGDDVTITHTLTPEGPTGFITYYVDGSETGTQLGINDDFVLSGLSAGTHTVIAKYGGDGSYDVSTSNTLTITVAPATLEVNVTSIIVHYPEKGTVNVTSNKDGVYTINVNNVPYEVTVANGQGSFDVNEALPAGEYLITWNIPATQNYTAATGSANYIVLNIAPDFEVSGESSIDYGQTNTITHTINSDATGTITYVVNDGEPVTKNLDETLTLEDLDAGHYTVSATYNGDTNYGPLTKVFEFDVLPIDIIVSVATEDIIYPSPGSVNLTVSAPGTFTVRISNKNYTITANEAGTYSVPVTDIFEVGQYDISVIGVPSSENYKNLTTDTIGIYNVIKPVTSIEISVTDFTYGDDASATITLKQGENPVAGKEINVTIDGTQQIVTTSADGTATVDLSSFNAGKYNIVALFKGDENYALAYNITEFTVNKATPTLTVTASPITYGQDATITFGLEGVDGEKLNGVLNVIINGEPYDVIVNNGVGTLTVSGLNANEAGYPITASFPGNDNYAGVYGPATNQVVNKANATLEIVPVVVPYGQDANVTIILTGVNDEKLNDTVWVYIDNIRDGELTITDGVGTYTASDLDVGLHDVGVSFHGNDNYNYILSTRSDGITVIKANTTITLYIDPNPVWYGGETYIWAEIADIEEDTPVDYYVGDWHAEGYGTEGFPFVDMDAGNYTVYVKFNGNDQYNPCESEHVILVVNKVNPTVTVSADKNEIEYGDIATLQSVVSPVDATGDVIYYVNGTALPDNTMSGFGIGEYTVVAEYQGNNNYNAFNSTAITITVTKATPNLTVTTSDITYGEDATISIGLTGLISNYPIDGIVKVTIDNKDYDVVVSDGVGTLPVSGLNANEAGYVINAYFEGNENYTSVANATTKQVVNKADPTFGIVPVEVPYGSAANVTITLTGVNDEKLNGTVVVFIDNIRDGEVTITNGVGTYTASGLDMGLHAVGVIFSGNDNYNEKRNSRPDGITVVKANVTITIKANGTDVTYGTSVWIYAEMEGIYDYVTYYIDGEEVNASVQGYLIETPNAGNHTVYVKYDGNNKYNPCQSEVLIITVNKADPTVTLSADATTIRYGETVVLSSDVSPSNATGDVIYYVDGEAKESNIVSGLAIGEHTVVAEYQGNDNYNAAESNTVTITVTKAIPDITVTSDPVSYPNDAVVNIALTGVNGAALPGTTVRVTFNGTTYAVVTDDEGKASLTLKGLTVDEYPIEAVSVETDLYESATNSTAKVVVEKGNLTVIANASAKYPYVGDEVVFSYTIVAPEGAVTDGTVTYIVDGGAIDGDRLSNLPLGEHNVVVNYTGDSNFNDTVSLPYVFEVIKHANNVSIECDPVVYPNEGTIILHVNNADNYTVTVGNQTFDVEITEDGGSATITVGTLDAGNYTVIVEYYQGATHTGKWFENAYNVLPAETVFTISPKDGETVYSGGLANVTVNLPEGANGTITYYVDGKEVATIEMADVFSIADLSVGDHNVYATYSGNNNYGPAQSNTITITVYKIPLTIDIGNDTVTYPDDASILIDVHGPNGVGVDGITVLVTVNNVTYVVETGASDLGTPLIIKGLDAGEYPITAVSIGDDKYDAANYTGDAKVVVNKATPTLTVTTSPIAYGEVATITFGLDGVNGEKLNGNLSVIINEETYNVPVSDGVGTLTVRGLDVNEVGYVINALFEGNDNYGSVANATTKQVVNKADTTITVYLEDNTITYGQGQDIVIWAEIADIDGVVDVTYYIGNLVIESITSGNTVTSDHFEAGTYPVYVRFEGNNQYNPCESEHVTLTINKANPIVELTAEDYEIEFGNIAILYGKVIPEDATGGIVYYVNGSALPGNTMQGFGVGEYTVVAEYQGNRNYNKVRSDAITITVTKATPKLTVTTSDIVYGQNATINIGLKGLYDPIDGIVKVTIDSKDYEVTVSEGVGTLTVSGLNANEAGHVINAYFAENENYTSFTNATTKQVVHKATAHVDSVPVVVPYGQDANVTITLTGVNDEKLNGTVEVWYDNVMGVPITITDGVGTFTASDLDMGNHTVIAHFIGNDNYNEITSSRGDGITVIKANTTITINANATNITYGDFVGVWAEIADIDDVVSVTYYVNGEAIEGNTDGKTLSAYDAGNITVYVRFEGNDKYNACESENLTITINKADSTVTVMPNVTTIKYGETVELDAIVIPDDPNADITYFVDEYKVEGTTVSGLGVGNHTVVAYYQGNKNYNEAWSERVTITVNKAIPVITVTSDPVSYPNDAVVNIALTAVNGTAIPGTTVRVTVNGTTYAVVTDEEGKASLTLKGLNVGEYPIEAVSVETDLYESATNNTAKVVVEKGNLTVIVNANARYYVDEEVVFSYTVVVPEGAVTDGTVTYIVDGEAIDGDRLSDLDLGEHNVVVRITGDSKFNDTESLPYLFEVIKHSNNVTIECDPVVYPNEGKIILHVNNADNYTVTVGGHEYPVEITEDGGSANITVDTLDVGTYNVIVEYYQGAIKTGQWFIDAYEVLPAETEFTISPKDGETPVYGGLANVTVNLPEGANGTITYYVDGKEVATIEMADVFSIADLSVGDHNVYATYSGQGNYGPAQSNTITITVGKATPALSVTVADDNITYGEDATINIGLTGLNNEKLNGIVKVTIALKDYYVEVSNGVGTLTVSGLDVYEDGHVINAYFAGNDNYTNVSNATTKLIVDRDRVTVEYVPVVVPYGQDATVTITVTGEKSGKVNGSAVVWIDHVEDREILITDGVGTYTASGLDVGPHHLEVYFLPGDKYYPRGHSEDNGITVIKANATITISADKEEIEYGDIVIFSSVVSPEDATGDVAYYVDDELVPGNFVIDLGIGNHTAVARYLGDDNYAEAWSDPLTIIVTKIGINLAVEANEPDYGEDTILTVNATAVATGFKVPVTRMNVSIDGGEPGLYIVNDDGTINLGKLDPGEHDITISFVDPIYQEASAQTVAKVNTAAALIDASAQDYAFDETGKLVITVTDVDETPLNGTVVVQIDDEPYATATVTDGEATVDLTGLDIGAHSVVVTFDSPNYRNVDFVTHFNVTKKTPVVTVTGTTVEYGTPATVTFTVTDEAGNPVTGTVIVVASWDVDGETQVVELETDGTGEATFKLAGVAPGTVDVNATFIANDNYTTAYDDSAKIIITPSTDLTLEVTANEATVGDDTILNVVATDGAGDEVPITKVNVTVGGGEPKEYDVDENGNVNIGKLPVGTTEVTVSYDDDSHEPTEAKVNVTVNKATADLNVVPGEGSITIEVKDNEGRPISGYAAVVIDGGEPDNVEIHENGTAEYPIDASPGPHTVEVTFTNEKYEPVTKTVTVIVPKHTTELSISTQDTPTYGDDVTIKANITEKATGTITYYVDGSTVGTEIAIGENFVVSGLSAGEHTIRAKYAGDDLYSPADSNVLTINVAKAELNITIDSATTYYPNKGTVEVSANNDGVYTINVNGKPYTVTIVAGKGTFEVTEVLPVAEYPITWDIAESENYTGDSGSAVYKVLNTAPDFSITGTSEIDYGNKNTIIPTINEDATGTITYSINGAEVATLGVEEDFVTDVLDAGHYTVTAKYSGDTNYGEMTKTFEFDVLPIDVVVSVSSEEVYYPNTGSINLTASAPGTYTVLVGNKSYEAVVTEAGVPVVVEVESLEVGKYEINVTAPASTNYKAVDTGAIGTYVVSKAKSVIEVTYNKETGIATVTLEGADDHVKLNETISFELDGKALSGIATVDGRYESEDLKLAPGKHSIFVVFVGNENYLGSYDQEAFEVDKFNTAEVTVSADPIKEGEDAIIKITVKDGDKGLSGVVTVTLDDTDYAVDVTDGEGTLTVKNLVAKETPTTEYPITAKFNGNDEYAEATGTGSIEVTDYNDVIIAISGSEEGAVVSMVDTDLNNVSGNVSVTVDGVPHEPVEVINGKAIIKDIEPGNHTIAVDFAGDETHPPANKTETVYVGKVLIPVDMTVTLADIKYTEVANAVVILKDTAGNLLNGTVSLKIGDQVKQVTVTDGRGEAKFSGLNANSYVAVAEFASDGTYAAATATAPLVVSQLKTSIIARNMTTTAFNVTEDGRIGQYFTWTLVDEKGRPLQGKPMSIGFNAKVYNRTTDANGQAKLQINLQKAGSYTFAISFLGDENYEGAFFVVKIDVNKQKANLAVSGKTYKASAKTKTLSATYKTKAGNPIVGRTVRFTVNGKTYTAKTDSNGVAKVNVSLTKAGSYSVKVTALGTNTYAETTKTVTLKLT